MTDLLRPGDTPPRVRTEAELQALGPDHLEAEFSAHQAYAVRVGKEDRGQGLSPKAAKEARARQLAQINRHAEAAETAKRVLGPAPDSPEAQKERWAAAHAGHRPLGQPLGATDPEMRQFYIDTHKASEEARMKRDQEREERLQREREENPPDPRAVSISAAVLADAAIVDAIEVRPRGTTVGGVDGGVQTISQLEIVDVGVLITSLRLLEEVRPFRCRDWAQSPKWPQRKPPVTSTKDLRESLARLKGAGFVKITAQGGEALIDYGERTIAIANEWGLELTETKEVATA